MPNVSASAINVEIRKKRRLIFFFFLLFMYEIFNKVIRKRKHAFQKSNTTLVSDIKSCNSKKKYVEAG